MVTSPIENVKGKSVEWLLNSPVVQDVKRGTYFPPAIYGFLKRKFYEWGERTGRR